LESHRKYKIILIEEFIYKTLLFVRQTNFLVRHAVLYMHKLCSWVKSAPSICLVTSLE